jgi:sterol desaturase/sphingolipid hydroxylase (fatty acid hydroxylase superfamily)
MSSVGVLVLNMIATQNAAWLFISATTSMYLIYEFMHFCCHVDENAFVRWCPLVNTLRRHHTAHHNDKIMMERNMNLTFPIADWLFGTSDLDRGLLGHLFNGYNTDHLKKDLRAIPLRPDEAAASPMPAE